MRGFILFTGCFYYTSSASVSHALLSLFIQQLIIHPSLSLFSFDTTFTMESLS